MANYPVLKDDPKIDSAALFTSMREDARYVARLFGNGVPFTHDGRRVSQWLELLTNLFVILHRPFYAEDMKFVQPAICAEEGCLRCNNWRSGYRFLFYCAAWGEEYNRRRRPGSLSGEEIAMLPLRPGTGFEVTTWSRINTLRDNEDIPYFGVHSLNNPKDEDSSASSESCEVIAEGGIPWEEAEEEMPREDSEEFEFDSDLSP